MNDALTTGLVAGIFIATFISMQTLICIKYELKKQNLLLELSVFGKKFIESQTGKEE